MALTISYLTTVKNLGGILAAIQNAGVPERFTNEFLKGLGFKSSGDRGIVNLLKGLGLLSESGVPTELYREYKNKHQAKKVLARAMKNAYGDIFLANEQAQSLSKNELKGIFSTKTGKGDAVVDKMAMTFLALTRLADFSEDTPTDTKIVSTESDEVDLKKPVSIETPAFHYNIQIYLPATKDISVYNAIFKPIRENLLTD